MPPVPPDLVRLQLRWEGGGEIAVNNLHVRIVGPAGDWQLRTQEVANLVRDTIAAAWNTINTKHWSGARLTRVDAYHLDAASGKTAHKATAPFAAGGLAGTASTVLPFECAIAVSLYGYPLGAYDPQGARKRGRLYLPFLAGGAITGVGRVAGIQALADAWAAIINTLHGLDLTNDGPIAGNREMFPVVLSRAGNLYSTIQYVRVDDLVDVQRRRQNGLTAAVATANITQE